MTRGKHVVKKNRLWMLILTACFALMACGTSESSITDSSTQAEDEVVKAETVEPEQEQEPKQEQEQEPKQEEEQEPELEQEQNDNNDVIGNPTIKVPELDSNELEPYGEIISSFERDINHDGYKDKLLLVTPEGVSVDDVERGFCQGEFYILEGYEDNTFSDCVFFKREFSGAHVGNGQMFVTTIDDKDYLIETGFWAGQGTCTYRYEVFFEDYKFKYSVDSKSLTTSQSELSEDRDVFFADLNKWINDTSYIIYAADIDYETKLVYSTEDNKISPREYLLYKSAYEW